MAHLTALAPVPAAPGGNATFQLDLSRRTSDPRASLVAWWEARQCLVNLAGNYDYLELPYYISQDAELEGREVFPTNRQMLDAYVPPLFLCKAKAAGLEVAEYYISNGYFEPPVIIDPINPFMIKSRIVWKPFQLDAVAKSMTRNFTYAICCQEIPEGSRIAYFASILGTTTTDQYKEASQIIWEVFHIPIARVRIIITPDGRTLMSDIAPLPFEELTQRQRAFIDERVTWQR